MEKSIQRKNAPTPRKQSGELGNGVPSWESSVSLPSRMESRLNASLGGGQGLPNQLRSQMEGAFGRSFSDVHIHTDSAAAEMSRSIGARAFTYGNDIFFDRGQFSPHSSDGQHLIAHELTHTVQQSRVVARKKHDDNLPQAGDMAPKNANHIGVTTTTQEEALRSDIISNKGISNLASKQIEVFANDEENRKNYQKGGLEIIDGIVSDCMKLVETASKLDQGAKTSMVQQVYNTLAQISVAMDTLPKFSKDMYKGEDVFIYEESVDKKGKKKRVLTGTSLTEESWIKSRTEFNKVVKKLAVLARNPAISVLMFEGTYYPGEYTSFTHEAAKAVVRDSDSSLLAYSGAVCNNAAYGSAASAGAKYQSSPDSNKAVHPVNPFTGLGRESRQKWSSYGLKGKGLGDNAFDEAKQGDVVVFWNHDKCVTEIKKQLNAFDASYPEDEKAKVLEAAKSKSSSKYQRLKQLETSLGTIDNFKLAKKQYGYYKPKKSAYESAEKNLHTAEEAETKAKVALDNAQTAFARAEEDTTISAKSKNKAKANRNDAQKKFDSAQTKTRTATTTKDKALAELTAAKENYPSAISYEEYIETIDNLAKAIFPKDSDSAADIVVPANLNASHIEVIVGVDDTTKKYLTSGAHGSNYVNGFSRTASGKLDWKSPSDMRNTRVMRVVPLFVDQNAPLISVNIPEIMSEQHYEIPKKMHDAAVIEAYNKDIEAYNQEVEARNIEIEESNKANPKKKQKKLTAKKKIKSIKDFESIYPDEKTRKQEMTALRERTNTPSSDSDSGANSVYSPGEYSSEFKVFVYQNKNLSSSVTINWLQQNNPPANVAAPADATATAADTAAQEQ